MSIGFIGIENLKVVCFVGVYPEEKLTKQDLMIDLRLETDFSKSVESDSLHDTLDYDKIASLCQTIANQQHYHLIETLANRIAQHILKEFPVHSVNIKVKKLQGLPDAKYAYAELTRNR